MAEAAEAPGTSSPAVPALAFRGAGVRLGGRWIWRDVTVEVSPGAFVALLGPNGSGKSTLLKAALGLIPLAAGSVQVRGVPARRGNHEVGYLPQRRTFDPDLRIRGVDLVRLGLDGGRFGISLPLRRAPRREAQRRLDEVLELVGAQSYARRPVGELSGGEQQRLLVAQALVGRPQILFLDEPLDSLDISNQQAISALVQSICRSLAVSVLLVAHDVNPLMSYLDNVIYVANGKTVMGTPQEVITTETLSALYGSHIEVLTTSDGRVVVVGQPEAATFHGHAHDHADR